MSDYAYLFKIILAGDSGVGKSCILQRLTENQFQSEREKTIGVEFGSKIVQAGGKPIKLQIWDTSGQEAFKAITRSYYRASIGAILVYEINVRSTFVNVPSWLEELRKNSHEHSTILLIGNKSDLQAKREVAYDEGFNFAKQNGLHFMECSAKSGQNIDSVFLQLAETILIRINQGQIDQKNENMGIKKGTYK